MKNHSHIKEKWVVLKQLTVAHRDSQFTIREHAIHFYLLSALGKKWKQQFFRFLGENHTFQFFLRKMSWEMDLKGFARYRKLAKISLLWSKLEETVSTSCKTASVADFFLKSELLLIHNFMPINEIRHLRQEEANAVDVFCSNRAFL